MLKYKNSEYWTTCLHIVMPIAGLLEVIAPKCFYNSHYSAYFTYFSKDQTEY